MNYKIAQFVLTPGKNIQATLEVYLAQPDADKEALAGKLFALIEIESIKAENLKIINFLVNTLNHNYYQNEKMILRERLSSIKIEHIFESALAKTNKKLAEFSQSEKIKLSPNALNITIGVIYNDSLHFANLGKNKALLVYKSKNDDSAKYKLADITEQTGSGEAKKPSGLAKLFSNVVSGSLPRGGYFVFANETFSEYLSSRQIIEIITALPPAGAAEQIKNTLSKINAYVPFLGIIIKNTSGLEMQEIKAKQPPASTSASISNLISTEEKTEKLLAPSGLINLEKWASIFSKPAKSSSPVFSLKDKIFTKRKTGWLALKKIFSPLKKSAWLLISLLVIIFKTITDRKALADFFSGAGQKIKNSFTAAGTAGLNLFLWYKRLGKINKILFSCLCLSLIFFSGSLAWQSLKNKTLEKQTAVSNLTSTIEQKQNQIDASLLYSNEPGAGKLLDEVKGLLDQLPQKNQAQKDLFQALAAKHQAQVEKISHVIRANPVELSNFINLNPQANPVNLILAKGKIYAADTAQKTIYIIDPASKSVTSMSLSGQSISRLDFPSLDKNNNIYYFNANNLIVLDIAAEKLSNLEIRYNGDPRKTIGLKQYNNRFYLADAASGQIYRFTKNAGQLANPVAWLNAKEDLAGGASLDIDGNIYLLKNNGQLSQYAKGKKLDFALAAVEPALSRPNKIMVSAEQNYIYIMEPAENRLIVFDKGGKFISQYKCGGLNNLLDFQIDEKNKKIYFLNNTSVYAIDLADAK
ncbi:MAG: hypothetical protein Q7R92_05100 [bacterium]|nr:hypothetical protein [bacterium]